MLHEKVGRGPRARPSTDLAGWNRLLAESERLRARRRARVRVRSTVTGLPLFVLVMSLTLLLPRDPYRVAVAVVALLVAAAVWEVVAVDRDVRRLEALGGVPDCPRRPGTACLTWCDCDR